MSSRRPMPLRLHLLSRPAAALRLRPDDKPSRPAVGSDATRVMRDPYVATVLSPYQGAAPRPATAPARVGGQPKRCRGRCAGARAAWAGRAAVSRRLRVAGIHRRSSCALQRVAHAQRQLPKDPRIFRFCFRETATRSRRQRGLASVRDRLGETRQLNRNSKISAPARVSPQYKLNELPCVPHAKVNKAKR